MADFIRFFIPFYFIIFFLVSFVGISYKVAKQIGKNPNVLPKDDSAYGLVGLYFKLVLFALFIYTILLLFFPKDIFSAFKINVLEYDLFQYTGIILMIVAFIWVIIAQLQMKNSWRIGIDNTMKTDLIIHGLFRFSRNPIFLGITISLVGFFLVFPTVIALAFLLTGSILMQIQIRLEEEYLLKEHGQIYVTYKKKVKRMLSLY
ncbi:isoprenylcysteine carboxylmethyltransferase family protein [Chryseobacterium sp. ES2]|uniref:Isoprenylcysteine carboxylmethyltransferase family protein n=1 Tax=Chryseobacterium metallicongregator TaxID=3073042 RepID=A0ABU1E8X7_9FLAO|nr:isoprenylcysteine carboxylmethyltransferase family protein [Chryseobacterium sp. ES2]MDR4954228.1 isoprenylcysteine carboxylmethyltransferase family protein [Chryseobacterium sp. ES2]